MSTFPEAVSRSGHSVQPASFSADLYKRELERVFGRSWLFVRPRVAGPPRTVDLSRQLHGRGSGHRATRPRRSCPRLSEPLPPPRKSPLRSRPRQHSVVRLQLPCLDVHRRRAHRRSAAARGVPGRDRPVEVRLGRGQDTGLSAALSLRIGTLPPRASTTISAMPDGGWSTFCFARSLAVLRFCQASSVISCRSIGSFQLENFGGDYYHFAATHGSVVGALAKSIRQAHRRDWRDDSEGRQAEVSLACPPTTIAVAAHGFYEVSVGEAPRQQELIWPSGSGREAVAMVSRTRADAEREA